MASFHRLCAPSRNQQSSVSSSRTSGCQNHCAIGICFGRQPFSEALDGHLEPLATCSSITLRSSKDIRMPVALRSKDRVNIR